MFQYSRYGIQDKELFASIYASFINWCKSIVKEGTFSTYMDGEPVCYSNGLELSYSMYLGGQQG